MSLSEPTKGTREWLRVNSDVKGQLKSVTKGMSPSKRRAAMARAASLPNRLPPGPRASLKAKEVEAK